MGLSLAYLFGKVEAAASQASKAISHRNREEQPTGGANGVPLKYRVTLSMLELYNEQLQVTHTSRTISLCSHSLCTMSSCR